MLSVAGSRDEQQRPMLGDDLVRPGEPLQPGKIYDVARPDLPTVK